MAEIFKFFRYGVVGTLGTLIDVVTLFILVEFLHFNLFTAVTLSFILAATNNFIWNKIWTFKNKNLNYHHQYIKFILVSLVGLALTLILMFVLNKVFQIFYLVAKLITSLIVLIWNYLGNRNWTFKPTVRDINNKKPFGYDVSIVIPAYNEEKRIEETLKTIISYLKRKNFTSEVIIVNDGSNDSTAKIVERYTKKQQNWKLINLQKNKGKGFAVKTGVLAAVGKFILFSDADGAAPIEELDKLLKYIKEYDIVIGSRKIRSPDFQKTQPIYRRIISRFGGILTSTLIKNIKDTQCGFKLMNHAVAKDIFKKQKIHRYGFDIEMLAIAQHYNYTISEIPIKWIHIDSSKFNPIKDTIRTLREFIKIQYNFLKNQY